MNEAGILILENELNMGGIEKKLLDFVPRLNKDRFRVVICCLKPGGYFKEHFVEMGVPFYDDVMRHKYDVLAYRSLKRIIDQERIDLIYTLAHPNTIIFSSLARRTGAVRATVLSIHASGSFRGGRLLPRYLDPFLSGIDRYIVVAHEHKRYLAEEEGLDESKMTVIHNGVDLAKYHPGSPNPERRAALGLPPSCRIVIAVTQLNPRKNIDKLLEAMTPLLKGDNELRLVIVGDGQERQNLESLAAAMDIGDRVVFTGLREDIDRILRESTMLVLPSRPGSETFPNVVLEAMATGLPVVATNVGSVMELVRPGQTGALIPHSDVEALRNAIDELLSDTAQLEAFGKAARRMVEESYDLEQMYAKREALFEELLGQAGAK